MAVTYIVPSLPVCFESSHNKGYFLTESTKLATHTPTEYTVSQPNRSLHSSEMPQDHPAARVQRLPNSSVRDTFLLHYASALEI